MSREEWVGTLPHGLVTAEVGVQLGVFSKHIVETMKPKIHYMVDCWTGSNAVEGNMKPYSSNRKQKLQLYKTLCKLQDEIKAGIARPIVGFSLDAVKLFEDDELDFVYIDALHTKEACYEDMVAWTKKVKVGGWVAGHDYCDATPLGPCGVPEAVPQFVKEHDYELHLIDDVPYMYKKITWCSKTWWFKKTH